METFDAERFIGTSSSPYTHSQHTRTHTHAHAIYQITLNKMDIKKDFQGFFLLFERMLNNGVKTNPL